MCVLGKSVANFIRSAAYVVLESCLLILLICCLCVIGKSVAHLIRFADCMLWECQLLI